VDSAGIEGRWDLVALEDVKAPYPRLHDRVDESFQSLRVKLAALVGWDLLADLENAFIPLSSAMSPGQLEDWLYTGRAFRFNTLPISAGWMVVVREDFGQETYWRVYLRTRFQDGSQGRPLDALPWNFNARYSGRPQPYEQGGELASGVPGGYWVDLTRVAAAFGWERLPALSNWRASYPSARFNEFVMTDGLDWTSAMREIYPPEVLLTLTPPPTATASTTPAPLWYRSPTPSPTTRLTRTPTSTSTVTASPSLAPSGSPTATRTPEPTASGIATVSSSPTATVSPTP
jgi:TolB protein